MVSLRKDFLVVTCVYWQDSPYGEGEATRLCHLQRSLYPQAYSYPPLADIRYLQLVKDLAGTRQPPEHVYERINELVLTGSPLVSGNATDILIHLTTLYPHSTLCESTSADRRKSSATSSGPLSIDG